MATTTTTINIPDQTPALNMPSIAAQLETSTSKLDIKVKGIILFISTCFNRSINHKTICNQKLFQKTSYFNKFYSYRCFLWRRGMRSAHYIER